MTTTVKAGGLKRLSATIAVAAMLCCPAAAMADCKPGALGTSRTIVLPRTFAAYGKVQHGALSLGPREVVLTFDDGPRPETTPHVLDALAEECVKATFLTVGQNLTAHPEMARRERREGHSVGIHSYSHGHMASLGAAEQLDDLHRTEAAYRDVFGSAPAAYRFPFLEETDTLLNALKAEGATVLSVDIGIDDWQPNDTTDILKGRLLDRLKQSNGGIILLHDANGPTADALPALLQALKDNGYKVVHLEWADK